jgi:hypothetical protein
MLKRSLGVLIACTIATVSCTSSGSTSPPAIAPQSPTTSVSKPPTERILATWRMKYTCEKFVRAYRRYGIADQLATGALGALASFGVDKSSANQAVSKVCEGAKDYQSTHYFRPNGYLIDYRGKQIEDDCHCYQLLGNHTFVSLGNDPWSKDVSLHYTILGDTLTFHVVVPDQCSTAKCRGGVAYAVYQYALGPWHYVSDSPGVLPG